MKRNRLITAANELKVLILAITVFYITGCGNNPDEKLKGEEIAILTDAPNVPPPIQRDFPTKMIINLEVKEVISQLSDGVEYTYWTFGGKVPGKFIRVREGDLIEFNLHNHPSSKLPHNIDLHAVTGPGGGAASSFTAPGHTSKFSFKALNPGLYVYHCATAPVGLHIANGMYGLILVEPKEGLPEVDREYYIMQSEFYTEGNYGETGLQPFSMTKAVDENPAYVVFNGSVGSLVGDNSVKAKAGETVRLYVGNGGPNLVSSFHVIGEIFDLVYGEGGVVANQKNVQTTIVPAGGSTIVDFKVDVPGTFILVDHSIFRAFNKGAIGMLKVDGKEDLEIFSGKQADEIYLGNGSQEDSELRQQELELGTENMGAADLHSEEAGISEIIEQGKKVFAQSCASCHQANGEGIPNVFPPLAKSDYLMKDKQRSISVLTKGLSGPITVNGKKYNSTMPPVNISDAQTAAVLTYVMNSWGNKGEKITVEEIRNSKK